MHLSHLFPVNPCPAPVQALTGPLVEGAPCLALPGALPFQVLTVPTVPTVQVSLTWQDAEMAQRQLGLELESGSLSTSPLVRD